MPDVRTIKGLNDNELTMLQTIFNERKYFTEAMFHPSVKGGWFQVWNPMVQDVVIIDKTTTVETLQQILGK